MSDTALQRACEAIVQRAVPKSAVPVATDLDWLELIDKIGQVIVRVIESCAQNFPPMAGPDVVGQLTTRLRQPTFLSRVRFRNLVASELGTGFFSRYAGEVAREAAALARDDEPLTRDVVSEIVAPGPLRPNFNFA